MTQKKAKPSASDLYASAWAALEAENEVVNEDDLRADGWKSLRDFTDDRGRGLYHRMMRNPSKIERKTVRVQRVGGIRRVTFFRPKL